jgi:hypothetical protein
LIGAFMATSLGVASANSATVSPNTTYFTKVFVTQDASTWKPAKTIHDANRYMYIVVQVKKSVPSVYYYLSLNKHDGNNGFQEATCPNNLCTPGATYNIEITWASAHPTKDYGTSYALLSKTNATKNAVSTTFKFTK